MKVCINTNALEPMRRIAQLRADNYDDLAASAFRDICKAGGITTAKVFKTPITRPNAKALIQDAGIEAEVPKPGYEIELVARWQLRIRNVAGSLELLDESKPTY